MNDDDEVNESGDLEVHPFIEALDRGDAKLAVKILRELKSLDGEALGALADMLDDDPSVAPYHPHRLKLKHWKQGKPSDPYAQRAISTTRAMMVRKFMKAHPNLFPKQDLAVKQIAKEIGVSVTTLNADMAAYNRRSYVKKSNKKPK